MLVILQIFESHIVRSMKSLPFTIWSSIVILFLFLRFENMLECIHKINDYGGPNEPNLDLTPFVDISTGSTISFFVCS